MGSLKPLLSTGPGTRNSKSRTPRRLGAGLGRCRIKAPSVSPHFSVRREKAHDLSGG